MNETEFAEEATILLHQSAPPAPSYADWVLPRGRQLRRRRHARRVGLTAAAAVVLAGVPTAIVRSGHSSAPAKLQAASAPPVTAVHDVAGENAPYWFEQFEQVNYATAPDGRTTATKLPLYDLWLGHSRPSVGSTGSGPDYPKPEKYPAFGKVGFAAATRHAWEDQWTSATDPATVRAYLQGVGLEDARTGVISSTTDQALFEAGYRALEFPGTTDFRDAIIAFMRQLPEVAVSSGTDDAGRAATLLTFHEKSSNVTTTSYVDLPTATLLETDQRFAPVPQAPAPAAAGAAAPAVAASRIDYIWHDSGPSDSAPGGSTTAQQQATALSIPANPDPSHPTCTPGKPADSTPLAAQMAAICLPDPAPGFPARRGLDYAGDKNDRSFYLSRSKETTTTLPGGGTETDGGGATVTIQIQPDNVFSLSGAKSVTPDSHGMVGRYKATGSTTVLGVPATEFVPGPGQTGLIFSIDGLGVDIGGSGATFPQLITLADSLHIAPQPAG